MKKTVIVLIYLLLISISVFSKNLIDVASGLYHTLLLFDDGKILAVGNNFYGQLGIGSAELERSNKHKAGAIVLINKENYSTRVTLYTLQQRAG